MAKLSPVNDVNIAVPAAVRAAAARADAAFKIAYEPPAESPKDPVVEPVIEPDTIVAAAPVTPEVTATSTPTEPAKIVAPVSDQTWEHKYNSMKGRHDRVADQLRTSNDTLAHTRSLLAALQDTPAAPAELRAESLLKPQEVAEYGSEFLDVVGRKAQEQILPELTAVRAELASLRQTATSAETSRKRDARTSMHADLDRDIPDWKVINDDQNFLNWLALPDTYNNVIRQELLTAAYTACDARRVAAFFHGFLAEEAATAPRTIVPDPTTPVPPVVPKVPLERFAAPGRAKAAAGNTPPVEKPSFTRQQITAFYADVNAGKFRGRDDEKNRIERDIFEAQQRPGGIR